jgi:hypothetical protein
MNQIAYEVGGVFLLAGLFIFGTMVKGFVPDAFRDGKPLGILCLLAIFGFAVYRWLPELEAGWSSLTGSTTATAAAPPATGKSIATKAPVRLHAVAPAPQPKIIIVEAAASAETTTAIAPEAAPVEIESPDVPAESPKQGNRVKRAVKSVGHFLHLGHRQPE